MENKKNKGIKNGSRMKFGDKVIIRETPSTKERSFANQPGVITKVDGEEIYVVYKGQFGLSGPYKLKADEVEKVIQ
jgi:transcription antitermination factor NusG